MSTSFSWSLEGRQMSAGSLSSCAFSPFGRWQGAQDPSYTGWNLSRACCGLSPTISTIGNGAHISNVSCLYSVAGPTSSGQSWWVVAA